MKTLAGICIVVTLVLGSWARAGEEPLVKKIDCPKCAADGKIPEDERRAGSMMLNNRQIATPYCPNCQGTGWLLKLPNGDTSSAATAEQVKAFELRIRVARISASIKRDEEALARSRAELAKAEAELKAIEQAQAEEKREEPK